MSEFESKHGFRCRGAQAASQSTRCYLLCQVLVSAKLPEPVAGDMFVDLEGDPFAGDQGSGRRAGIFVWICVGR